MDPFGYEASKTAGLTNQNPDETTVDPEGGDRLSIGNLERQDAAKAFAERDAQRLTEDEVEQIICHLPKRLSMTPLRIGVEISGLAQTYLQMRRKEEAARRASKVQRDLNTVVLWLDKVVEWTNRDRRRRSTGIPRLRKAIEQLEELANDEAVGVVLGHPLDEEVVLALKELRRALKFLGADTNARLDLSKTQNLRDLIQHLATEHIEEIRDGKTSRRRSAARELFLDRLADLYPRLSGKRPTFKREMRRGEMISAFGIFAEEVFLIVDPTSLSRKQRNLEDSIQGAVVRFRRCTKDDQGDMVLEIAPSASDPRDRKRARGRIFRGRVG